MIRAFAALIVFAFSVSPLLAAGVTSSVFYLDAAKEEVQLHAVGGYVEFPLPKAADPASLRVRPLGNHQIKRVFVTPSSDAKRVKELQILQEKRNALQDRLKALAIREEVFASAAKAQSGKAPRKTKTNPEPVVDIRKGTEYALDELEEVFRLRRNVHAELEAIEARLKAIESEAAPSLAKIWLTAQQGKIALSYIRKDRRWSPDYVLRLIDGEAFLELHALVPEQTTGAAIINAMYGATTISSHSVAGDYPLVLSVTVPSGNKGNVLSLTNTSQETLPAGKVMVFDRNEYVGTANFPGCAPGAAVDISPPVSVPR